MQADTGIRGSLRQIPTQCRDSGQRSQSGKWKVFLSTAYHGGGSVAYPESNGIDRKAAQNQHSKSKILDGYRDQSSSLARMEENGPFLPAPHRFPRASVKWTWTGRKTDYLSVQSRSPRLAIFILALCPVVTDAGPLKRDVEILERIKILGQTKK